MSRRLKRIFECLRRDEGSNLVEMAISSTVLFGMLFGICQMSIAFYAYNYASDAARQATRYAMVRGANSCANTPSQTDCGITGAGVRTYVRSLHYPGIRTSSVSVSTVWCAAVASGNTITWPGCSTATAATPGNMVKITVTYPLTFIIPFINTQTISTSATSEMVITQ